MSLPSGSHCVRLCSKSTLGDDDEVTVACFQPHPGTDHRPADNYLSVHWLEYLGLGTIPNCLASLRAFLLASTIPGERRPTSQGKLAVINCEQATGAALAEIQLVIDFKHEPRLQPAARGYEVLADGAIQMGLAPVQAVTHGIAIDPHCGMYTLPEAEAHRLAVQQYFVSQVIHIEPGK